MPFVIEFPFVLGRPAPLPDPWTTAPDACVLEARRRFEAAGFVPAGFTGRVGLMLVEHDGIVRAEALLEPVRAGLMTRWQDATAALVQPRVEDEDVREALLVDGKGRGTTFREVLAEVFAPFPDRDDDHGGREQRARRAVWRGFLTDGTADRSSFARYLRTVGSLTCVFRAIDATDSPFRRKRRIDCTWGMLIIILSGPFWRRYKHHPVKTIPWSACSA